MLERLPYREVWAVDFEFIAHPGERPDPICLVAHELRSGRKLKLWRDQFGRTPPYPVDPGALFVAYYASAELGCHLALGRPLPVRNLDLFAEFRRFTNGLPTPAGSGLIGACTYFGIDGIAAERKDTMRSLILSGGPWNDQQRRDILDYCESDVIALGRLLETMLPHIDLPRALLRGRYMAAAARIEYAGVPIDVPMLDQLRAHWTDIQDALISEIDSNYHVFDGRTFKAEWFEGFLIREGIPWPRLESGRLDLSDETFRQAARAFPIIAPLRELRSSLAELRLRDLAVGHDGRNRTLLSAFRATSGRNQPSNSKFIFGPAVWLRGLIKPPPGFGLAYCDWAQQEFGIAAALSGDEAMMAAYASGDPYLAFAIQAGAAPRDATRDSLAHVRELHKTAVLAVQYGMQWQSLAGRLGQPPIVARDLLRSHRETYRTFWRWSDAAVDLAMLSGSVTATFGWTVHAREASNPRSLRNFPMQANGAEMLRIACCLATERGVEVCAPVHDAVLIAAPIDRLEEDADRMRACMAEASCAVLKGFELRTDVKLVRYPDRYMDPRGKVMWERVVKLIDQVEACRRTA